MIRVFRDRFPIIFIEPEDYYLDDLPQEKSVNRAKKKQEEVREVWRIKEQKYET